jgi:hypothetical protein
MNEIIEINRFLLISGLLWVTGLAFLIVIFSQAVFYRNRRYFSKKILLTGGVLIAAGIVLNFFRIPTSKLLVTRAAGIKIEHVPVFEKEKAFSLKEISIDPLNKSHKRNSTHIVDNTVALFYDGYIKLPLLKFKPGEYRLEFFGRGTDAMDEYAILEVSFDSLNRNHYLIPRRLEYVTLNRMERTYTVLFTIESETVGRLRISFVNDDLDSSGKRDRNAWVRDIRLGKK